ncbi:mevalonate kinase [Sulfolobales archaeon HS-7]|nr:mevalonate kinase [Sulfolobales archaeon HS-7]
MIIAKVPLKVTLFGEHAIVYNKPAIAATINEYLYVKIKQGNNRIIVSSPSLTIKGVTIDLDSSIIINPVAKELFNYIIHVIDYFGKKPVEIEIDTQVEPSVGLGTSAAVVVGTTAAYSTFLGYKLSREEIAKISFEIEKSVQKIGSRMDTFTEALGGIIFFTENEEQRLSTNLKFTVGYIIRSETTRDILKRVSITKQSNPELVNGIFGLIETITNKAKTALVEGRKEEIGRLMYINHGLLNALGITDERVDYIIGLAKKLSIDGCKISGGGGGGAVVCLKSEIAENLLKISGAKLIDSEISNEGVTTYST